MINKVQPKNISMIDLEKDLMASKSFLTPNGAGKDTGGFLDLLNKGLSEVNTTIKSSEKASMDLVSGKSTNIHETMLAASKAELGFNLIVQLRNKAIEAYQEVMRMQV